MHKKTFHTIWILLVVVVTICFAVFMNFTVPEVNTLEQVEKVEEMQ